jgi:hypothetical protein
MGFWSGVQHRFVMFLDFCNGLLRERDGTPSSTRTLLYIFSAFDMWAIWRVIYHVLHIKDVALLGVWLANLPMLIGALIALAALPYTVNQGFNGIANMITQLKNGANNPKVQEVVDAATGKEDKPPVIPKPAVGSAGEKG